MPQFRLLVVGRYLPGQIGVQWTTSSRIIHPEVESAIESAWQKTISKPGVRLFDGRVARLESFDIAQQPSDADRLSIQLSPTSYRIVVGTNFVNPHLASDFGNEVMANPLGVSTGLLTSDGYWMMGRRNRSVAYYPQRVHPFAGSLEVRDDVNIFDDVRRELREELSIGPDAIQQIVCHGLAIDEALLHPEAIFLTNCRLSRDQITEQLDHDEHESVWFTPATPDGTCAALSQPDLTPVAQAVLLLNGRERFGDAWFEDAKSSCFQE